MRVVVIGSTSYVGRTLPAYLRAAGHDVIEVNRRSNRGPGQIVGDLGSLPALAQSVGSADAVVNFALLKSEGIDANMRASENVRLFCELCNARLHVHISSVSAAKQRVRQITERTPTNPKPELAGPYAAIKAATEGYWLGLPPQPFHIVVLRPGFVIDEAIEDPIVGMAAQIPGGRSLVLASGRDVLPVTTVELVNRAIEAVLLGSLPDRSVLHVLDPQSPRKAEWVRYCVEKHGLGGPVLQLSSHLFWLGSLAIKPASVILGDKARKASIKLSDIAGSRTYASASSSELLGLDMHVDWRAVLDRALGKEFSYRRPDPVLTPDAVQPPEAVFLAGLGRIATEAHLPALKELGVARLYAYDPGQVETPEGVVRVDQPRPPNRCFVTVCTPAKSHLVAADAALAQADGVLVEKPAVLSRAELSEVDRVNGALGGKLWIGHNYRFKDNVLSFLDFVARHPCGDLHQVQVSFDSPSVRKESAAWAKEERVARTLLMDYAVHFLDLACLFSDGAGRVGALEWDTDRYSHTSRIAGFLEFPNHTVSFLLRQGLPAQRCLIEYAFENVVCCLRFFPESFDVHYAKDDFGQLGRAAKLWRRGFARKVREAIAGKGKAESHKRLYQHIWSGSPLAYGLQWQQLRTFYETVLEVADRVYGGA